MGRKKKNLCGKKKEIKEFIIFGRISAHFAYQGIGIGRGLFYSRIKVPSLLQFFRTQAASLQSEGASLRVYISTSLFFLDGIFLKDRFIQFTTCSVLLWVLLPPASQSEQGTDAVLAGQD